LEESLLKPLLTLKNPDTLIWIDPLHMAFAGPAFLAGHYEGISAAIRARREGSFSHAAAKAAANSSSLTVKAFSAELSLKDLSSALRKPLDPV
jgi:hypothetical protein